MAFEVLRPFVGEIKGAVVRCVVEGDAVVDVAVVIADVVADDVRVRGGD